MFGLVREMSNHALLGNDEFVPSARLSHVSMQVVDLALDRLEFCEILDVTAVTGRVRRTKKLPVRCCAEVLLAPTLCLMFHVEHRAEWNCRWRRAFVE